jgi:hypothetical protein
LLSVSQLCEKGYNFLFTNEGVTVSRRDDSCTFFTGQLQEKLYYVDFTKVTLESKTCLVAKSDLGWLWHHRLAHVGMRKLAKFKKMNTNCHLQDFRRHPRHKYSRLPPS